jgi:predicted  nucleic acid-binding Zn-ribbon protein
MFSKSEIDYLELKAENKELNYKLQDAVHYGKALENVLDDMQEEMKRLGSDLQKVRKENKELKLEIMKLEDTPAADEPELEKALIAIFEKALIRNGVGF